MKYKSIMMQTVSMPILKSQGFIFILFFLFSSVAFAQQKDQTRLSDTLKNYSAYKRKLTFAGVLQTRYVLALDKNVDINGKNFDPATSKAISNTFLVKRARIMVKGDINDHFSANILANLAEFNSDPSNKVLENAYIKYSMNQYFHIQAGQFRPFFGIEDVMAVDIIRTLDFSNQYYAFGKNGWQSFQTGLSIFGNVVPGGKIRYFAGAYNGNNKNQSSDDNNTKNLYARLETDLIKDFTLGVNAGTGSLGGSSIGQAYGADATAKIPLSSKFDLLLMAEYKKGANFLAYNADKQAIRPNLDEYQMQGFYFFPTFRYNHQSRRLRAVEFSCRYEYFDENYKLASNSRQTLIPNVSLIFADDFYAALQVGVAFDRFKNQVPLTTTYNRNLGYVQLQIRF
ncbi:porin [Pedobacter alluvionis]|uniref:Porin n=1 Tax=Pedobacter alluvionis TaxID=475253 RepID=A0A497XYG3_9SPHI|nr:porin [Pedobacter alluvionis]RLJ72535.1 phosphate-selective porin O/P [Pedobacter alluvionis]TFB28147.1 porin [Pedobacter alluvionis]